MPAIDGFLATWLQLEAHGTFLNCPLPMLPNGTFPPPTTECRLAQAIVK
jgi:hypothetical protein